MSRLSEQSDFIVLRRRSELLMAGVAINRLYGVEEPLAARIQRDAQAGGFEGCEGVVTFLYQGEDALAIRTALLQCVQVEPVYSGQRWERAQSAAILGIDLAKPDVSSTVRVMMARIFDATP